MCSNYQIYNNIICLVIILTININISFSRFATNNKTPIFLFQNRILNYHFINAIVTQRLREIIFTHSVIGMLNLDKSSSICRDIDTHLTIPWFLDNLRCSISSKHKSQSLLFINILYSNFYQSHRKIITIGIFFFIFNKFTINTLKRTLFNLKLGKSV